MMMVAGVTLDVERPPAVAVPPVVWPQAVTTFTPVTEARQTQPYRATGWQQHPNPYDRTLQDTYDLHGKVVHHLTSGTRIDKLS